jgi:hypothetical protein
MSHEKKRPVTIEDLLRLKRTEQPSVEFWEGFDRQLRAKQLAALVEKRPWWQRMQLRPSFAWRRYSLPLGAVAALAVTFVSLRHTPAGETSEPIRPIVPATSASIAAAPSTVALPTAAMVTVPPPAALASAPVHVAELATVESAPAPVASLPAMEEAPPPAAIAAVEMAPLTPLLEIETKKSLALDKSPAAASFVSARVSPAVLMGSLLDATQTVEELQVSAKPARVDEPLAQMVVSQPAARSRLIAAAMATVAYLPKGPPEHVVLRQAQGLSDEQLLERRKGRMHTAGDDRGLGLGVRMW